MNLDLDLKELGARLAKVDILLMELLKRRMELAFQVGTYKMKNGKKFIRINVENQRLAKVRTWARKNKMNPHFVNAVLYSVIGESCKQQLVQLQNTSKCRLKDPENDDHWYRMLKSNLLKLAEGWSKSYDESYDKAYFATHAYLEFENSLIKAELEKLASRDMALDIGCATGRMTFLLAEERFEHVIGYDLSPHMIEQAQLKLSNGGRKHAVVIAFKRADLEDSIPEPNSSVSLVVMNLGTASDMRNIAGVLKEVERVLKPGGRFFFSFYNKEALVYRWDFIPWPTGLAAEINIHKHCLDVHAGNKMFSIYARPYAVDEAMSLFQGHLSADRVCTYPTISSILPSNLFENQPEVEESITEIDRLLSGSNMGAYIAVTGSKRR